jgi:hypothetical protein
VILIGENEVILVFTFGHLKSVQAFGYERDKLWKVLSNCIVVMLQKVEQFLTADKET